MFLTKLSNVALATIVDGDNSYCPSYDQLNSFEYPKELINNYYERIKRLRQALPLENKTYLLNKYYLVKYLLIDTLHKISFTEYHASYYDN